MPLVVHKHQEQAGAVPEMGCVVGMVIRMARLAGLWYWLIDYGSSNAEKDKKTAKVSLKTYNPEKARCLCQFKDREDFD